MNKGELKTIVDDFVELVAALEPNIGVGVGNSNEWRDIRQAELIAGQIIAGKAANGDYKGKNFYHEEEQE